MTPPRRPGPAPIESAPRFAPGWPWWFLAVLAAVFAVFALAVRGLWVSQAAEAPPPEAPAAETVALDMWSGTKVIRVRAPGGWVYVSHSGNGVSSCFVPAPREAPDVPR